MKTFREIIDEENQTDMFLLDYLFDSVEPTFIKEDKDPLTDPAQPWGGLPNDLKGKLKSSAEDVRNKAIEVVKAIYNRAIEFVKACYKAFNRILQLEGAGGKILISIKSLDSFLSKTVSRGKPAEEIHDVLRGAILMGTNEEVEKVVASMRKRYRILEYDYKTPGSDKEYGYFGSHHFKMLVNGTEGKSMICEVQVMTRKLWAYKKVAHDIYAKWRDAKEIDSDLKQKDMILSRQLFKLGNS